MNMRQEPEFLADEGMIVELIPHNPIYIADTSGSSRLMSDSFCFRVDGRLMEGQLFYGLCGPILVGMSPYTNLICNLIVRLKPTDWTCNTECRANFKIGRTKVERVYSESFYHPLGTSMEGWPVISGFADIKARPDLCGDNIGGFVPIPPRVP